MQLNIDLIIYLKLIIRQIEDMLAKCRMPNAECNKISPFLLAA